MILATLPSSVWLGALEPRALSISPAKPVSPALPLLPLMESTSPSGDFGNVNKRCQVCRRRCRRGDVNGKHPKLITVLVYLNRLLDRIFLDITGLLFPFIQEGSFLFWPPTVSDWEEIWLDCDPAALPPSTIPSSVKSCSKIENYRFLNKCYHHQWCTDGRQKVL